MQKKHECPGNLAPTKNPWTNGVNPWTPGRLDGGRNPWTVGRSAFSALGGNLHFVISGYFVISDLVITGVSLYPTCYNGSFVISDFVITGVSLYPTLL